MGVVLAAVGAVVAALLQLTIATRLPGDAAQLNIVLVFAVVWTIAVSFEDGLALAFVGGLTVDLLAWRPMGTTVLAMLVVVGTAALLSRFLAQSRLAGPVVAVFLLSICYSVIYMLITSVVKGPVRHLDPSSLATVAAWNTVLAALITPPLILAKRRLTERERVVL